MLEQIATCVEGLPLTLGFGYTEEDPGGSWSSQAWACWLQALACADTTEHQGKGISD